MPISCGLFSREGHGRGKDLLPAREVCPLDRIRVSQIRLGLVSRLPWGGPNLKVRKVQVLGAIKIR